MGGSRSGGQEDGQKGFAVERLSGRLTGYLDALSRQVLLRALKEQGTISRLPRKAPTTAPAPLRATAARLEVMTGYWACMNTVTRIARTPGPPQLRVVGGA